MTASYITVGIISYLGHLCLNVLKNITEFSDRMCYKYFSKMNIPPVKNVYIFGYTNITWTKSQEKIYRRVKLGVG